MKALKFFDSILKNNPLDDLIWKYKGETLAKLGNFNEAIDCYNKAIEILPEYMTESLWMLKGRALSQISEFDKAIECFNQVLKINPDSEIAENEKHATKKLKEKSITNAEKEVENLNMRINDAYETHQKLRRQGIQSDILQKTLYDALSNENFKERMLEELIELAKDRKPTKDKPVKQEVTDFISKQKAEVLGIDPIVALRKGTVRPENADEHKRKIREFEEKIKRNPNNSNLRYEMGSNYLGLGEYDLAIKCYNKALILDPNKYMFRLMKGTAYLLSERYHNAFECYQEALRMKPGDANLMTLHQIAGKKIIDNTPVYVNDIDKEKEYLNRFSKSTVSWFERGLDAISKNQYEKALNFFDEALRIEGNYASALLHKGHIYYFRGEYKQAIKYYNKIIELNLDLATLMLELWVNKGVCHRQIGEKEQALNCYGRALEINPQDFDTIFNLGNVLSDLDRLDEALESYNLAIKLASEEKFEPSKMMCNKGLVLIQMKRYNEALYIIDKAIEIDPIYPLSWYAKGLTYKGLNEPKKALECFNESLRFNPELALALYEKAILLNDLGESKEALACFDAVTRIKPGLIINNKEIIQLVRKLASETGPVDNKFTNWYEKGMISLKNNEFANAVLYFDKYLDHDLRNADVWLRIAEGYNYLKRFEYAEQCFNKSLQLNPENPNALKVRDKMGHSSFFESGIFYNLRNPITGVKVEGNNLREKCTQALRIFRPYLILNNSELKIVDIKNKMVHVGLIGDLNEPFGPPDPIYADIESFLRTIDPTLNIVVVKFM